VNSEEKAIRTEEKVKQIARRRYREGKLDNPYGDSKYLDGLLRHGISLAYEYEMERLKNTRICPTCGQPTMGDLS